MYFFTKNMKYFKLSLFVILLHLIDIHNCKAQNIIVKDVKLNFTDASASTNPRIDENGIFCALVKIIAVNKDIQFSGNIVGPIENKTNEYWVYMKKGSDNVTITAPSYPSLTIFFKEYNIESLQSKATYNITLSFPKTQEQINTEPKTELSFSECKKLAETGNPADLVNLGKCYLYGIGTIENTSEATRCFEKAAKQGYPDAIYLIGNSYYYGLGNTQNYELAFKYYTDAAKKDYIPAIYSLGLCYEKGKGVKQNTNKAMKHFKYAASKGYTKALNKIKSH